MVDKKFFRVSLDVSPKFNALLEKLMQDTNAPTRAEVLRRAVSLYAVLLDDTNKGNKVIIENEKRGNDRQGYYSMKLYEIMTGEIGESYVRAYAWAECAEHALDLFMKRNPGYSAERLQVFRLFSQDDPPFCTKKTDGRFTEYR
jgi:hypothetical protein